ncbi:MAG: malto-oligosyltrehalose synthase [Candidatus Omnitrophica bacterium]|nr:malto-oligosyltrehalose synthase [Candidatus Omnitrophota bacterium]
MRIPLATYRIQFNPSFTFASAKAVVSYLADLGISTLYASPVFEARKGSSHGYDIVDHARLNPELGTQGDFESLISDLKGRGMWWLQDIVPNHMAYDSQNRILMDVLENGERSRYFNFFDIDWSHPYEDLKGRLLAPFLGEFYSEALEKGEIRLKYDEKGLFISYYNMRFPLKLSSYKQVFMYDIESSEERLGKSNPNLIKLLGILHLFENISDDKVADTRYDQIAHAKAMLRFLYKDAAEIRQIMDRSLELLNGKENDPGSFDNLDRLLSEQPFRLSFWKVATEEINYRRFFNINALISLKVEREEVFDHTHGLISRLIREEKIHGLRVDHIDGLFDPAGYLEKLRALTGPVYTVVEKILAMDKREELPDSWPIQGTTGYDFLNQVNGVFCKSVSENDFIKIYYRFTGLHPVFEELTSEKKRLIIGKHMAGTIDNLARTMKCITASDRYGKDITLYGLKRALVEVLAFFQVYRTYADSKNFREQDRLYIKQAVDKAREKNPGLIYEFNFIENFFLSDSGDRDFIMRFQQFTGPLMAKGFEDTVLYSYNKLISLNEVGGNPSVFGVDINEFHDFNQKRVSAFPHSLNATSTHDAKRGEDVRARVNVLSEIPVEWRDCLRSWSRINRPKKKVKGDKRMPDANDEYFLYQTLIGAFPFDEGAIRDFKDRIKAYMIKAVREAKVHTAWIKPDTEYEDSCAAFVEKILDASDRNRFLKEFIPFQRKVAFYGVFNSLSQTLMKMTSPGVPDFYQGSELWDLNLVDPDNRKSIDFKKRVILLNEIKNKSENNARLLLIEELLDNPASGAIKLFLIYRTLKLRREKQDLFQSGDFTPLVCEGRYRDSIVAYARRYEGSRVITVAPRFLTRLVKEGERPLGEKIWGDTYISLPDNSPSIWKDAITDNIINCRDRIAASDIFKYFPAGLLINSEA